MSAFAGMRGTGDWVTDQRPKNWREMLLRLYPNGEMPLTAITSKLKSEKTDDPEFNWWTKKFPDQAGAITGVYLDTALSVAYTSTYATGTVGANAGATVYVKMAAATIAEVRIGHQLVLRDASAPYVDVNVKVTAKTVNGANSYLTCVLLEDDDNDFDIRAASSYNIGTADRFIIVGNINEEGAAMPGSITYDPTKYYNYTQIFRTPLSITRTARMTRLRTGPAYQEAKRECLELHGIEMEKAFIFGIPTENTGTGGKPERTTQGIIDFVRKNVVANHNSYSMNTAYTGKGWTESGGGEAWLDSYLETLFRFGSSEKIAICGSTVLLAMKRLALAGAHMDITPKTTSYGLKIVEWVTPWGTINMKLHPLMSQESSFRKMMILFEPKNIVYRYITDTTFYGEGGKTAAEGTNYGRYDATNEEFLTEAGLELRHPDTFMILDGFGDDCP